ncbi:MAG: septal ring lytic transglycosylase RlpA family protein [Nitrospirae bacterium]|nr:septal ring lytic transglycosylase RlpA family protein [Nitrospirota bacterium]
MKKYQFKRFKPFKPLKSRVMTQKNNTRVLQYFIFLTALLLISSCASYTPRVTMPPPVGYVTASWYGPDFHGKQTSSGERYDMYAMTCAHKTFPFGTNLRVTNPVNNKSVVVTVNDRGPFIPGRDLDLSYSAAKEIGLVGPGVGRVRIEHLGRNMRYVKRVEFMPLIASGPFTVQVGAFQEESNALHMKQGLELRYKDVAVASAFVNGNKFYRVRIGSFVSRDGAYSVAQNLADEGYTTFITKAD